MSIKEKSFFINKTGKVKVLSTYDGIGFINKMIPRMGDLYKEAFPKRGDFKKKLKNYNGNRNSLDFHPVPTLL